MSCQAQFYRVTTVAGIDPTAAVGKSGTTLPIGRVISLATNRQGDVFFTTERSRYIQKVKADGTVLQPLDTKVVGGIISFAVDQESGDIYGTLYGIGHFFRITPAGVFTDYAKYDPTPGNPIRMIVMGPKGTLYFLDVQQVLRIDPDGKVTALSQRYDSTGCTLPTEAVGKRLGDVRLCNYSPIAVDSKGTLYLASIGTEGICRVTPAGMIDAIMSYLWNLRGVAVDASDNVFFTDTSRLFKIIGPGLQQQMAGGADGKPGYSGDGGRAVGAKLSDPGPLAIDAAGNIYVADRGNSRIRKITRSGDISTFVGTA